MKKQLTPAQMAMRVATVTLFVHLFLMLFKLIAGLLAKSYAMVADSVHTASDILVTVIVMIGIKMSAKKADQTHPYGHERFEAVAAVLLSITLAGVGIAIGWAGIDKIISKSYGALSARLGVLALVAAVISIFVQEGMYWYARHYAKKINSSVLMADAWHHRADALSSVGSFAGILAAYLGVPVLDPIVSLVICAFIIKTAISIFIDAIKKMTDEACDPKIEEEIKKLVMQNENVLTIDLLKTRRFASRIYVDLEIGIASNLSFVEAHSIATEVHNNLEAAFSVIKHCTVHANPHENKQDEIKI